MNIQLFVQLLEALGTKTGLTSNKSKGTLVNILSYLPIISRLGSSCQGRQQSMSWHKVTFLTSGAMTHPSHGWTQQHFDNTFFDFAYNSQNVQFGLYDDGFSPTGYLPKSYSIWIAVLIVYNLPPWLCMTKSFFILTLLIPHRSHQQNINVYLSPLIDDLHLLQESRV